MPFRVWEDRIGGIKGSRHLFSHTNKNARGGCFCSNIDRIFILSILNLDAHLNDQQPTQRGEEKEMAMGDIVRFNREAERVFDAFVKATEPVAGLEALATLAGKSIIGRERRPPLLNGSLAIPGTDESNLFLLSITGTNESYGSGSKS